MSDALELLLILVLVFVGECLVVVRLDGRVLVPWWPGRYRVLRPFALRGSRAVGVVLAPPWPPLESGLPVETLGVDLDPTGLRVGTEWVLWEALPAVRAEGRDVRAGGDVVATSSTEREARRLAAWLDALRQRTGRGTVLTAGLDARFDVAGGRDRLASARRALRIVRAGSLVLYAALFGFMPVALFTDLPLPGLWVAALGLVGWALVVGGAIHQRQQGFTTGQLVTVALSPLAAMRAADLILREVLLPLEPVAAAWAVDSPDADDVAREALADWTLRPSATWLRRELGRRAEQALVARGGSRAALFAPPPRDPGAVTWCPRCRAQFMEAPGQQTPGGGAVAGPRSAGEPDRSRGDGAGAAPGGAASPTREGECATCGDVPLSAFIEAPEGGRAD